MGDSPRNSKGERDEKREGGGCARAVRVRRAFGCLIVYDLFHHGDLENIVDGVHIGTKVG